MNNYISSLHEKSELRIMMICLGNICRSPMAAAVLANQVIRIQNPKITVSSSGTGSWHVGDGPNPKSKATWESAGYSYEHIVQQFKSDMFDNQDLLLVMDNFNYKNVVELTGNPKHHEKVFYLRQFDPVLRDLSPEKDFMQLEVPDPYYEPISAFQEVLIMVEAAVAGLITELTARR